MKTMRIALGALGALSFGCSEEVYKVPTDPLGAVGAALTSPFGPNGRLRDPNADSDGDGLEDGDELEGWVITVDPDGYQVLGGDENLETRKVSSDPRWADTDGDGLTDGEERSLKSDPRRFDTDGDTLGDAEEVERFGTSPASVDTDGDARGGGPTLRPPLAALFDGNELRLEVDPKNPTGPRQIGLGATAPYLADTDGDGVNDYDETLASQRRPNVAEVPELALVPTPGAVFDLYLNVETLVSSERASTYGVSHDLSEAGHIQVGSTTSIVAADSAYGEVWQKNEISGGCCFNLGSVEGTLGASLTYDASLDVSVGVEFGSAFAVDTNHVVERAQEAVDKSQIKMDGGTVRVPFDLENRGTITVGVEGLVVSLMRRDRATQQYVPVAELTAEQDVTLAAGERRTVLLANTEIPLQPMLDFLADPSTVLFTPARFDLVDQYGADFDFTRAEIRNHTAILQIDAAKGTRRYLVAANADKTRGTTVGLALSELGIDFEARPYDADGQPGNEAWQVRIGALDTEFWTGPAPALGDAAPYVHSSGPGPRLVKRGWFGFIDRFADDGPGEFYANLFEAPLHPGDVVTLLYSEDLDRDGLSAAEEARLGSRDSTASSDGSANAPGGDGLSDFWEAREGWTVAWPGRAAYRVFSSPGRVDSDGDGLSDEAERGLASDPRLGDTDGDGRADAIEAGDSVYGLSATGPEAALPGLQVTCWMATAGENRTDFNGQSVVDPYYVLDIQATDAQADLVSLTMRQISTDAIKVRTAAPSASLAMKRHFDFCPDPADLEVTGRDALGNTTTVTCSWGSLVQGDTVIVFACEPEPSTIDLGWRNHYPQQ